MIKAEMGLDLSEKQMRKLVSQSMDKVMAYLSSQERLRMSDLSGLSSLKKLIEEPLPSRGVPFEKLLKTIFDELLPKGVQVPSPGYLAYVPVGSIFPAVVAEFISYAINRWPALYRFSPGFVEVENRVVHWLCEMMGLPNSSGGTLTSGGSMANLGAIVAARHSILGEDFSRGTVYFSEHAHHSVEKSARIVGIARANLRAIPGDEKHKLSLKRLTEALHQDQENGLRPFLIVANAGTTATGAIDDLIEIAGICKERKIWFHVDAAWAGSLMLTRFGKRAFKGIELADSITFDPHKALYTPFGCGALLVRHPKKLMEAHSFDAAYLPDENEQEALMSPSKLSPELSRGLRGLQVWIPIKYYGIEPFRKTLEEKLQLTQWITRELKKMRSVEITFEPQTAIVGFRYFDPKRSARELNLLNQELLESINADGRILLSGVELGGVFSIRIIPFGQKTHFKHVNLTKSLIQREIAKMNGRAKTAPSVGN